MICVPKIIPRCCICILMARNNSEVLFHWLFPRWQEHGGPTVSLMYLWNTNKVYRQTNTVMLYSNMLHVSIHQDHHRAPLLQKFKNIGTYSTSNSFVSENSLIYKVPDDSSDEQKHVAYCCIILKCCVTVYFVCISI